MADELTLNATLQYDDSEGDGAFLQVLDKLITVTTKRFTRLKQNVGITEEALNLGDVSSLGYIAIKNLDATNFVSIRKASGETAFAKVSPGRIAIFEAGVGLTAPYVIADTAACQVDILVVST